MNRSRALDLMDHVGRVPAAGQTPLASGWAAHSRETREASAAHRKGAFRLALLLALTVGSGCAAAVGAAMAAGEIRQGIAGLQQVLAFTRTLPPAEVELPTAVATPLAGTYRGFQVLGDDTIRYFVRTARDPIAPIVDQAGAVTGYALPGLAAATLDTLEARVAQWSQLTHEGTRGRAIFFVEGTQPPNLAGRTLYPAAFLGRISPGESDAADRQDAELQQLDIVLEAPEFPSLSGQGIPHELFGSVVEGIFTLRPDGSAVYRQEHPLEDGRLLVLHFERISATTLP